MPTDRLRRHTAPALGVLTLLLGATLTWWVESEERDRRHEAVQANLDGIAMQIAKALEGRMQVVSGVLRAAQGLFQSSNEVTHEEWSDWVENLETDLREEGVRFLAFAARAAPGKTERLEKDAAPRPGGFAIRPLLTPPVPEHRVFLYVTPRGPGGQHDALVGYDLATEPTISGRLDLAADRNDAVLTPPCPFGAEAPDERTVALCLPVFAKGKSPATAEGRRKALDGWVFAAIATSQMIDPELKEKLEGIDVEVFDGERPEARSLLFDLDGRMRSHMAPGRRTGGPAVSAFTAKHPVAGKHRTWSVQLSSLPEFEAAAREKETVWIPWVGAALTILSSALVWSLARTRAVAIALADERSAAARSALAEVELQRDQLRAQSVELERARDEALAAARVKSEFIATVSHEIRTPMNGVVGMTSLLVESPLLPEQREYASHIRRSADQLLAMVNDLLDFSKLEAGRLRVEALPFDIRTTCEEAAEAVRPLADAKQLRIRLDVGPSVPPKAVGDALRIRQVLVNLLGNAVKFSSAGEVLLSADVPERSGGDILLRLRVQDHGIGIAPEVLPLLFQPFTQAEASTTRRFGGSGLGLAISKRLVELMGGKIGAVSRVGEGSTFEVLLRLPV